MFKVNVKSYIVQPMESLIKIGLNIKQSGDELCQALAVLDVFTQHLINPLLTQTMNNIFFVYIFHVYSSSQSVLFYPIINEYKWNKSTGHIV